MPELSIEIFAVCQTAIEWETTVPSSKGDKTYKVRYNRYGHRNPHAQYDYSCDCQGYQFRGTCRHIEQVLVESKHCNWHSFIDGGKETKAGKCPKCGGPVTYEKWGV